MRIPLTVLLLLIPVIAGAQAPAVGVSARQGATAPVLTAVTIDSPASGATEWFARADQRWVSVEPRTGVTPTRVSISVDPTGLRAGTYRCTLRFVDDAADPMLVVPVVLTITPPTAAGTAPATPPSGPPERTSTPTTAAPAGVGPEASRRQETAPLRLTSDILPAATRNMPYTQAIPVSGGKPPYDIRILNGRLPVGILLNQGVLTGLTKFPGTYPITVMVTDSSTPPQSITRPLHFRVLVLLQGTMLSVSVPHVTIEATKGQVSRQVRVGVASGAQVLGWSVSGDAPWMVFTPPQGVAPGQFGIAADTRDLTPGAYAGILTITMDGAPNSPMRIPVRLTVR